MKSHALFNDNKTAFVFGATGIYSTTELFKCTSAIESLVKIGGWSGDIYLLIDDTTCLDRKLIASIPNPNIHIIPFTGETDDSNKHNKHQQLRHLQGMPNLNETAVNQRRMLFNSQPFERSMAIKTHILDYVKPNIETAIWYDCDVIFALPGCVKKMVTVPLAITKKQPFAIPQRYHVGTFAVKKNESNQALIQWREKILGRNGKSSLGETASFPDYMAFKELFGGHKNNQSATTAAAATTGGGGGSKEVMTDEMFVISPHVYHDRIISANISVPFADQTECVIHLTNGRCRHIPQSIIQSLTDGFHLDSLKGKKWCPSLIRRKFKTYGWKWPFCQTPSFFA